MSGEIRPSYEFGPFRLEPSEHRLCRAGQPVALTPKAFDVLRVLVEHAGHLVDKDTLVKEVWPDNFVEEGALNRNVFVIRKALGETPEQRYVETVPKRGYRFVAPVITVDGNQSRTLFDSESRKVSAKRIASIGAALTVLVLVGLTVTLLFREPRQEHPVSAGWQPQLLRARSRYGERTAAGHKQRSRLDVLARGCP